MSDIDIRYFYDGVKYIKDIEPKLFTKIKKIRSLKRYKDKWSTFINVEFSDTKNNKKYYLKQFTKQISLTELSDVYKKQLIISVSLDDCGDFNNDYIIKVPNHDIPKNTIYSSYRLSDKNKKEHISILGELVSLYNHFKVEPTSRFLDSDIDKQLVSLFLSNHSSYPVLMDCLENNITELTDETFTYLMFKLMATGEK